MKVRIRLQQFESIILYLLAFSDEILNATDEMSFFERVENIVGKGNKKTLVHFLQF